MAGDDDSLKSLLRLCIAFLCLGAGVLMVVIFTGDPLDQEAGNALVTAIVIAFVTLAVSAAANLIDRQPGIAAVGYLTFLLGGLALIFAVNLIWGEDWLSSSGSAKWAWYTLIGTFALGNTSVLLATHDDADTDGVKLVRLGTVIALWALVVTVIAEISTPGERVEEHLLGATAVLYGLGALVLPLLRRAS